MIVYDRSRFGYLGKLMENKNCENTTVMIPVSQKTVLATMIPVAVCLP